MIFGNFERTDSSPARYDESEFAFYNRCRSIAADRIRVEIESWLTSYPTEHREGLVNRFQRDDFGSAFFELLLHKILVSQDHSVSVHPNVGTKNKFPDFEVKLPNKSETVILEATLCQDDKEDDATAGRMRQLYDSINASVFPFVIFIDRVTLKSASHQPSSRNVASFFHQLSRLDPEVADCRSPYEDDVVKIDFRIVARGNQSCRNIAKFPFRTRWGSAIEAGRKTLNSKAKRYGQLNKPFVIAINTVGPWGYDEEERLQTLFGTRQEYVSPQTGEVSVRDLADGFWGSCDSPKYTRVSGVIFACVYPTNVPRANFCLYRNPCALHPVPNGFWNLPIIDVSSGSLVGENVTMRPGDFLGLPRDWPGELFP